MKGDGATTGLTLQLVLELSPSVVVLRNEGVYRLIIDGFDEPLTARKLNDEPASGMSASVLSDEG